VFGRHFVGSLFVEKLYIDESVVKCWSKDDIRMSGDVCIVGSSVVLEVSSSSSLV
jgi:hypothetical protein